MIIGIALVVDELNKGQRLVCRYPESIPSYVLKSDSRLLQFHKDYLSMRQVPNVNVSIVSITIILKYILIRSIFLCSPDNFAKLFRPKSALFNKVLELVIDDIQYLSFPCPCAEDLVHGTTDVITLFNIIIASVRINSMQRVVGMNSNINIASQFETNYFSR